ncbi:MAG: right-handed parallel beta-helix repeat-containing protein [Casimicrobiaceae bacterium]
MSIRFLVVALVFLGSVEIAHAAQRTFVASNGLDTNPCSIGAPCRSFGAAISQTDVGGEVLVVDSAGYGPVTITKSVSLISPSGVYAGISVFSGAGITIDAAGAIVVLRGLSINGLLGGGDGVNVIHVARLRIEGCEISRMGAIGIRNNASGSEMIIFDTIVRDNAGGISIAADLTALIDHVRSERNVFDGLYIGPATGDATATVTDSVFAFNGINGIIVNAAAGANAYAQVERTTVSRNGGQGIALTASSSGGTVHAMLTRNAIQRNSGHGILMSGAAPGFVGGFVSENAIHANGLDGINVAGSVDTHASANTVGGNGGDAFNCSAGSAIRTQGNNSADSFHSIGGCLFFNPGI